MIISNSTLPPITFSSSSTSFQFYLPMGRLENCQGRKFFGVENLYKRLRAATIV